MMFVVLGSRRRRPRLRRRGFSTFLSPLNDVLACGEIDQLKALFFTANLLFFEKMIIVE